jgi:hypothetical protein
MRIEDSAAVPASVQSAAPPMPSAVMAVTPVVLVPVTPVPTVIPVVLARYPIRDPPSEVNLEADGDQRAAFLLSTGSRSFGM